MKEINRLNHGLDGLKCQNHGLNGLKCQNHGLGGLTDFTDLKSNNQKNPFNKSQQKNPWNPCNLLKSVVQTTRSL